MLLPGFLTHVGTMVLVVGLAVKKAAPWWVPVAVAAGIVWPFVVRELGARDAVDRLAAGACRARPGWPGRGQNPESRARVIASARSAT